MNGLGRETNLLGALAQPLPRSWGGWLRLGGFAVLMALPLLLWEDYLRSIYRSNIFAGVDAQTSLPGVEFGRALADTIAHVRTDGLFSGAGTNLCILAPLLVQAVFLIVSARRWNESWWRVGIGYVLLLLVLDRVLVTPSTGAITRVMLPLTVSFNVLLMRERRRAHFWPWLAAGNLHLIPGWWVL